MKNEIEIADICYLLRSQTFAGVRTAWRCISCQGTCYKGSKCADCLVKSLAKITSEGFANNYWVACMYVTKAANDRDELLESELENLPL